MVWFCVDRRYRAFISCVRYDNNNFFSYLIIDDTAYNTDTQASITDKSAISSTLPHMDANGNTTGQWRSGIIYGADACMDTYADV